VVGYGVPVREHRFFLLKSRQQGCNSAGDGEVGESGQNVLFWFFFVPDESNYNRVVPTATTPS